MDKLLASFITSEAVELINAENAKVTEENEELQLANKTLLEEMKYLAIQEKRVKTLETLCDNLTKQVENLEQINHVLRSDLGIPSEWD